MIQEPIEEFRNLRDEEMKVSFNDNTKICSEHLVYEAIIEYAKCSNMKMILREGISLAYEDEILTLDLGQFGAGRDNRKVRLEKLKSLQIFADTSSLEIFVNHGEEVFTSRIYNFTGKLSIEGQCKGNMTVYSLKPFSVEGGYDE